MMRVHATTSFSNTGPGPGSTSSLSPAPAYTNTRLRVVVVDDGVDAKSIVDAPSTGQRTRSRSVALIIMQF